MKQKNRSADVFHAITDPTRRAILDLLMSGDCSVNELCRPFRMTRPAVSQHLSVLRKSGLAIVRRDGAKRIYRINPIAVKVIHDWIGHYERLWKPKHRVFGLY